MAARPSDLPDFKTPPVTEVALGLQFNSVPGFLSPHLGVVWERFKTRFPHLEEHHALLPVFETFGTGPAAPQMQLELLSTPPMPRVYFVNEDRSQLLQIQRDRFVHNWRKIGVGGSYPRFERMLDTFLDGLGELEKAFGELGLATIVPNQCEVNYINQIEIPAEKSPFAVLRDLFGDFWSTLKSGDLGEPEDANVSFRYIVKSGDAPVGRLYVQALPARRADGANVMQLTLTARGLPLTEDATGVRQFLELGREHMVRIFTQLTTDSMHRAWGRTK